MNYERTASEAYLRKCCQLFEHLASTRISAFSTIYSEEIILEKANYRTARLLFATLITTAVLFGCCSASASNVCTEVLPVSVIDGFLKTIAGRLPNNDIIGDTDLEKLRALVASKLKNTKGAIVDVIHLRDLKISDAKTYPEYKTAVSNLKCTTKF